MRPYRPSNGTEGEWFMSNWCYRCEKDDYLDGGDGCPIIARTMLYDLDDDEYPTAWQQDENGVPFCTEADLCD